MNRLKEFCRKAKSKFVAGGAAASSLAVSSVAFAQATPVDTSGLEVIEATMTDMLPTWVGIAVGFAVIGWVVARII